jgi:hypothetical protein
MLGKLSSCTSIRCRYRWRLNRQSRTGLAGAGDIEVRGSPNVGRDAQGQAHKFG